MTDRIKINVASFDNQGSVFCADQDGNHWAFKGEAYQELASAVNAHGSINSAKWELVHDAAAEKGIAALEAEEIDEWDEEAQFCTDNEI